MCRGTFRKGSVTLTVILRENVPHLNYQNFMIEIRVMNTFFLFLASERGYQETEIEKGGKVRKDFF